MIFFCVPAVMVFGFNLVKSSVEEQLLLRTNVWWPCFWKYSPILAITFEPPSTAGGYIWVNSRILAIDIVYFIR